MEEQVKEELKFEIGYIKQIPSVNRYFTITKNGRLILQSQIVKYKNMVTRSMLSIISRGEFTKKYPMLSDDKVPLRLEINAYFNYRFKSRDVTNIVKHTEDAIYKYLGINDKRNVEVLVRKHSVPHTFESLKVNISNYVNFK